MDPRNPPTNPLEMAKFIHWVKQEAKKLEDNGEIYSIPLRRQILKAWELYRPEMLVRLNKAGIAEPLANILQARMYATYQTYLKAGMPYTDAREQAEQEWLMLEPEEPETTEPGVDQEPDWESLIQSSSQD